MLPAFLPWIIIVSDPFFLFVSDPFSPFKEKTVLLRISQNIIPPFKKEDN